MPISPHTLSGIKGRTKSGGRLPNEVWISERMLSIPCFGVSYVTLSCVSSCILLTYPAALTV